MLITILIVTNPGNKQYQSYASEKLITYLKGDLCEKITEEVSDRLRSPCLVLIDTAQPQIKVAINNNTQQQNFFLFSLYQTKLSISPLTPKYHFGTLGIFNRFFTYQAETNE